MSGKEGEDGMAMMMMTMMMRTRMRMTMMIMDEKTNDPVVSACGFSFIVAFASVAGVFAAFHTAVALE